MSDEIRALKDLIRALLGEVINRGFFDKLEPALETLARTPDEDIDEELLNLLDALCLKICGQKPSRETKPRLRQLMDELCGGGLDRLRERLIYPNPDKVQEHIAEATKTKKLKL